MLKGHHNFGKGWIYLPIELDNFLVIWEKK